MPIKSRWRNQFFVLETASNFHNKVRDILATDTLLKGFSCYQEVPVKDLIEDYDANHFFDWYIEELGMIIELHGAQHYKVVNYGNISYEDAQRQFKSIQARDKQKKAAALAAGYKYVEVNYKEYSKLTSARLKELMYGD